MILTEPNRKWGVSRGFGNGHDGIDYKYPENTPVTAAADGVVGFEGYGQNDPWTLAMGGIYVRIQHGDGSWTGYAHLSRTTVNKGQKVKAGQVIGYSGHTGQATGPHLHFEVIPKTQDWDNGYSARIDPAPFFSSPASTTSTKGGDMITRKGLEAVFLAYLGRMPDTGAYTHYVGNYDVDFVVDDVKKSGEYSTHQKNVKKQSVTPVNKSAVIDYITKNLK